MEKIVLEKGGKVLHKGETVFDKSIIECKLGHRFEVLSNDLQLGKWCEICNVEIPNILRTLNIPFQENVEMFKMMYDFVISTGRNFVILVSRELREDKISAAEENGYKTIVVDFIGDDAKEKIWNSIRDNKSLHLRKEVKEERVFCETVLENGDSVVKEIRPPYPENKKQVIGYVRVSTAMQVNDGFSLEAQEGRIKKESDKMNGFLKSIYIDRGISGGSMEKRLALERMMLNIRKGDWIVVNSVSRLARKTKDLLEIAEKIQREGCHLMIIDLNMDITSPSGKLILTMMGSQAQFEREITSERVKGVMQHLKKEGKLRTKPPYGWKMNPDHSTNASVHIHNDEEQEVITKIRTMRSQNSDIPITTFAEVLNREGVPPPRESKKWYHRFLKDVMNREGIV